MVLVKEYRIPLPFSLDEFRVGHGYMSARAAQEQALAASANSVRIVDERAPPASAPPLVHSKCPFSFDREPETLDCSYLHREFHLTSYTYEQTDHGFSARLAHEERSWHSYPYIKTVYTCPMLGSRFSVLSVSYHTEDMKLHNALGLPGPLLRQRVVDLIDIAREHVEPEYYKEEEDPRLVMSEKTGRGKLGGNWMSTMEPMMCAYKLVIVDVGIYGLRSRLQPFIQDAVRGVYVRCHRQCFCWLDEWINLTEEDVEGMRRQVKQELEKRHVKTAQPRASPGTGRRGWLRARL